MSRSRTWLPRFATRCFPLAGQPVEALVPRGGRATIVVELPALPIPGSTTDPRRTALAATMTELDRAGAPFERQTLLVATGLAKRAGHRELELLVNPEFARRFHGRVEVHDAESPDLVDVGEAGRRPLRVNRALVETDVVVLVTAAETVLNGARQPSSLQLTPSLFARPTPTRCSRLPRRGAGGSRSSSSGRLRGEER